MQTTYDLYDEALSTVPGRNKAELARRLDVHVSTWTRVEQEKHLPAAIAGKLAIAMQKEPRDWIAIAALEAMERKNPADAKALRRACRYVYLSTLSATRCVVGKRVHNTQNSAPRNPR